MAAASSASVYLPICFRAVSYTHLKLITLDKKRNYKIKSCSLKAGVYRMELERIRG